MILNPFKKLNDKLEKRLNDDLEFLSRAKRNKWCIGKESDSRMEDAMRDIIEVICSARNQVMIYLNKEEGRFYDDKKVIDVIKRSLKFRNLHIAWLISRDQRPYLNQKICNLISQYKGQISMKFSSQRDDEGGFILADCGKYRRQIVHKEADMYEAKVGIESDKRDILTDRFNKDLKVARS